jgi:very-short-patch-repair endonuclease
VRFDPAHIKEYVTGSRMREQDIILLADLRALHIGVVEREYRFEPLRRWRFDYCIPKAMLACEIEGGTFREKSRHTTGAGFQGDCDKYNHASAIGWTVFRFTTADVLRGHAKKTLRLYLDKRLKP